jgi:hypothetical protein
MEPYHLMTLPIADLPIADWSSPFINPVTQWHQHRYTEPKTAKQVHKRRLAIGNVMRWYWTPFLFA